MPHALTSEPTNKMAQKNGPSTSMPSRHSPDTIVQRKCACGGTTGLSGECEACRNKRLQRKTRSAAFGTGKDSVVPPIVHEALRAPGQPLDPSTRAFMESRFGYDFSRVRLHVGRSAQGKRLTVNRADDQFEQEANQAAVAVMRQPETGSPNERAGPQAGFDFSQVRIHTDGQAAASARAIHALAYTAGEHIVFGAAQYSPATHAGRQLLAHELAHVVQQGQSQTIGPIQRMDWGPLGGKCCNESPEGGEWALVGNGTWESLSSGACTGILTDCDGMTCGGGFYQVSNFLGGVCKTPRKDDAAFSAKRWTPTKAMANAKSPTERGSKAGNVPTGYQYDAQ